MPTTLGIAAQITVDAEPQRVWRAAPMAAWGFRSSPRRCGWLFSPA